MNKDNIRLWVDALRSGEYQQTREGLSRTEEGVRKYCCLGVACDLAILDGVEMQVERREDFAMFDDYDDTSGFLPPAVQRWLGFEGENPLVVRDNGEEQNLTYLNDDECLNFGEIADLIENTYLKEDR